LIALTISAVGACGLAKLTSLLADAAVQSIKLLVFMIRRDIEPTNNGEQ
jgi:hypothetical protein